MCPQTTPERAARWRDDQHAMDFLEERGYTLLRNWQWRKPEPGHKATEKELDAIIYLVEEWDFDGIESEVP